MNDTCFQIINRYNYNITKKEYDTLNYSLKNDELNFDTYLNSIGYSVKATKLNNLFKNLASKVIFIIRIFILFLTSLSFDNFTIAFLKQIKGGSNKRNSSEIDLQLNSKIDRENTSQKEFFKFLNSQVKYLIIRILPILSNLSSIKLISFLVG